MAKYVTDTAAGKSVSAYIVLNKQHKQVATVRAHFGNSGNCFVNIFDNTIGFQYGSASGYGYDKFTAALSGLVIDGIELHDHCGHDSKTHKLLKAYHRATETKPFAYAGDEHKAWLKKAEKLGASFANWDTKANRYMSLHIASGLDRLKMAGYTVIQAI
jgi:hypothetical protein